MKILVASLVSLIAVTLTASAEPSQSAIELMKAMEIRKNIDSSMERVQAMTDQMIAAQGLTPEQQKIAKDSLDTSLAKSTAMVNEINWEQLFADIYTEVFSEEEIKGLLEFYNSPTGKKFLAKQPELMALTMQTVQEKLRDIMPEIQRAAQEAVMKAKSGAGASE